MTEHQTKKAGLITIPITILNYDLDGILSCCFEGGSNYWIDEMKVLDGDFKGAEYASEVVSHDGELRITVGKQAHLLDKGRLIQGCRLYVNEGREWKPDNFDADNCDVILQYALFGDIVFG